LIHACLEGPELGVYYRGKSNILQGHDNVLITLPDYVGSLATDLTVHVTPIYNGTVRVLNATEVNDGKFNVWGEPGSFTWIVYGKRAAIDVEPDKDNIRLMGSEDSPYRWIEQIN